MDLEPLLLTLEIGVGATLVTAVVGLAVAALLANVRFPGRELVDVLFTAPLVLPPTVLGYFLLVGLGRRSVIGRAWEAVTGSPPPYDHYGRGVWIEADAQGIRKYFVEGSDPGVAFRSAVYPAQGLTLTILANTGRTLWPLYREIEALVAPLEQ